MAKTRAPKRVASGVYRADAVGFPNAISVLLLENDDDGSSLILTWGVAWGRIRDALATVGAGP